MTKTYTCLFACLFLFTLAAFAQKTFEKSFGGVSYNEYQYDLKKMKPNGYLVAGITDNFGAGSYDAYCIKLNAQGSMVWSKTYGTAAYDTYTKVCGTADSGFVMAFATYEAGKDSGVVVVKCNKQGNLLWSKCIKDKNAGVFRPSSFYEDKTGNIYLLYDWNYSTYYGQTFTLVKLTALGTMLWNKVVDTNPLSTFAAVQIAEADNGDILVVGNSTGDNWITYGSFIHLFAFSKVNGVIKTCKKICSSNCYDSNLIAYNIVFKNKQVYVTGGISDNFASGTTWFNITKGDGQLPIKTMPYTTFHDYQYLINNHIIDQPDYGFASDLVYTEDAGYLFAYRYLSGSATGYDIIVDKYDSLGRVCKNFTLPAIDTNISNGVVHISDKNYALLANTILIKDYVITVTDVTANKTLCSGFAAEETAQKLALPALTTTGITKPQLYPNPATDFVIIAFEAPKTATLYCKVLDAQGKVVLAKTWSVAKGKQQTTLTVSSLNAGLYHVSISGLDEPIMLKFIKGK